MRYPITSTGELPPLIVSYSEINAYMKCPLMWSMEWRDRWRRPVEPGGALDMGTAAHEVTALHYKSLMETQGEGVPISMRLELARNAVMHFVDGHPLRGFLEGMYARYVGQWKDDPNWEILGVEHQGDFHLGYVDWEKIDPGGQTGTYGAREVRVKWIADLIVRDNSLGGVMVYDNKTCSALRDDKSLEWDIQLPTYLLGAMLEHPEWNIIGGAHNEIRKPRGGAYSTTPTKVPWGRRTVAPWNLESLKEISDNLLATVQEMVNAPDRPRSSPSTMTVGCDWCAFDTVHQMMRQHPREKRDNLLEMEGFEADKSKRQYDDGKL